MMQQSSNASNVFSVFDAPEEMSNQHLPGMIVADEND